MLTDVQLTALKNDIAANVNTIDIAGVPTPINQLPNEGDFNVEIANWYNANATPDYFVWRDLPMETVLNLITFASMTPVDAVPTTPALTVDVYRTRSIVCQGKQLNLQNLILGRTTAPMKKTNYRAALQDCLTGIPAGAGGALIAANWNGVRDAAKFLARRIEKLLATGNGAVATPSDLTHEGTITGSDVQKARDS